MVRDPYQRPAGRRIFRPVPSRWEKTKTCPVPSRPVTKCFRPVPSRPADKFSVPSRPVPPKFCSSRPVPYVPHNNSNKFIFAKYTARDSIREAFHVAFNHRSVYTTEDYLRTRCVTAAFSSKNWENWFSKIKVQFKIDELVTSFSLWFLYCFQINIERFWISVPWAQGRWERRNVSISYLSTCFDNSELHDGGINW